MNRRRSEGVESPEPDLNDLRDWASETIGVQREQDLRQLQGRLLRRLELTQFVPPDDWHDAVNVLVREKRDGSVLIPLGYYQAQESELRTEVEQFVESFFSLPPGIRRQRWAQLSRKGAVWPPLRRWLQQLERGLDVERRFNDQLPMSMLTFGRLICEHFLQPPGVERQKIYRELATLKLVVERWKIVALDFRRDFPEIAQLSPEIVDGFTNDSKLSRRPPTLPDSELRSDPLELLESISMDTVLRVLGIVAICVAGVAIPVSIFDRHTRPVAHYRPVNTVVKSTPTPPAPPETAPTKEPVDEEPAEIERIRLLGLLATPQEREQLRRYDRTMRALSKVLADREAERARSERAREVTGDKSQLPLIPATDTSTVPVPLTESSLLPTAKDPDHE